ncbi:MAG: BTAD domain-containing putative transcriptional regulator [Gaiellaceae bacterium]
MEFRLLGLLEVTGDDGRAIEIVRGHESGLIALLLLHANEALSPERIVDELWAGAPPENARKSVHIYISRLRKALGPERIETTPAGYRLRVAPDELDVAQFESLAIEGRAALDRGAAEDAESVFDRALALWRVAPLADYRFEAFAQAAARRLEERYADVVADRVDARIACARAHLVGEELAALIERSPLWERPRAQLMRALYLTGRQAEALELYRDTRTLLQDELGVEPGPELQRLERQILNHDPDLGEPTPPPRPVLRQRRFQFALVLACVLVAAVVYAAVGLSRGGASSSTSPNVSNPTQAVSAIDPRTNRVVSTTAVGRLPGRIVADRNAVWTINAQDETISRIDPRTRRVVHTFAPGSIPTDLAPFANALWVATPLANRVLRLDESTDEVSAQISAPNPLLLGSGGGKLWILGKTVQTFDPATHRRTFVFDPSLPGWRPSANTNGSAAVVGRRFFSDEAGRAVTRFGAATGAVRQSKEFNRPPSPDSSRITAAKGSLWLTLSPFNELLQVNQDSLAVIRKLRVGVRPVGVTFGAGSLWVANSSDGTVMRIDPANGRILATIRVGGTPFDLTFAHHLAWVTIL